MKNEKKYYLIVWIVAVVIFHAIMFLLPDAMLKPSEGNFWVIYLTVMASFLGQAYCSSLYAKKENKKERFLYIPVVLISYIALLMTLLLALQALTLQFLPNWFTVIVALLVVAYYAFAVIRTLAAADMVMAIDKKVEQQTDFIRSLTAQAKALEQSAGAELRPQVKQVYEAIRYSDPMSSAELAGIEAGISGQYESFAKAVRENQAESVECTAQNICNLLKERNELCKQMKR